MILSNYEMDITRDKLGPVLRVTFLIHLIWQSEFIYFFIKSLMSIWKMIVIFGGLWQPTGRNLRYVEYWLYRSKCPAKIKITKILQQQSWWLNREVEQNPKTTRWCGETFRYVLPNVKMLMRQLVVPPQIALSPAHNWLDQWTIWPPASSSLESCYLAKSATWFCIWAVFHHFPLISNVY